MAILIVTAVIAGACQLLQLVATQRRAAEYRALALSEASNVMEDLLSRSWSELAAKTPEIALSQTCRERLPSPQMRIDIAPEDSDASSRRISVEIVWQTSVSRPVRLVAWRYQPMEAQP